MKQNPIMKAFTLIELLLVMGLLGILALLLFSSFSSTLKRGRDQQRKDDLNQVQKALEIYYEDNHSYPAFDIFTQNASGKFCTSVTCAITYMVKTPKDPSSSYSYRYVYENPVNGISTKYYLFSFIENTLDQGSGVSQRGYANKAGFTGTQTCDISGTAGSCKYYVDSSNADPLIAN